MELVVAIAIMLPLLALIAGIWLIARRMSARAKSLRIAREKLEAVVEGHREMAESHESTVEELQPRAKAHREAAADHAERAEELEARIARERRQAEFHEERAGETEDEHGRL